MQADGTLYPSHHNIIIIIVAEASVGQTPHLLIELKGQWHARRRVQVHMRHRGNQIQELCASIQRPYSKPIHSTGAWQTLASHLYTLLGRRGWRSRPPDTAHAPADWGRPPHGPTYQVAPINAHHHRVRYRTEDNNIVVYKLQHNNHAIVGNKTNE